MKIAVLGCGAIGGLFLGYLSRKDKDVTGIVRDYQKNVFKQQGLIISKGGLDEIIRVKADTKLDEEVDLAIFASKINDLEQMVQDNLAYLKKATAFSTQNGLRADYILREYFPENKIITSIVMFGATFYPPNRIINNFDGALIVGNIFGQKMSSFKEVLNCLKGIFEISESLDIKGAKYLKLFINLNNCIPACLGQSMQEVFSDMDLAKLAIKINQEAYRIVAESGIKLNSLPTYPKERIEGLASMDINQAANIFSKVMGSLSKEPLYGSILQSIKRNKPSEIDYINGEITKLAQENNLKAPLNKKIVELVHKIEKGAEFLSKEELLRETEVY
ncbi:MAG: ketopantoate reductase family protein [Candidatus Omnitrophica bacterium]|jgi:2-dehydropantoate 2-reductase|nr:ketopantoate reductase family protein [Candidatus Omnitrophota bacterium]